MYRCIPPFHHGISSLGSFTAGNKMEQGLLYMIKLPDESCLYISRPLVYVIVKQIYHDCGY